MSAGLEAQIQEAFRAIPEVAPLERFVATNPLQDLEGLGFARALGLAERVFGVSLVPGARLAEDWGWRSASERACPERAAAVDEEVASLLAWYVARPRDEGCYDWWRNGIAREEPPPADPLEAIARALELLGVCEEAQVPELARQGARLVGWAGLAKWCDRARARGVDPSQVPGLDVVGYLALRCSVEAVRVGRLEAGTQRVSAAPADLSPLRRRERLVLNELVRALPLGPPAQVASPLAEVVLCIDPRSEPLRRHLEAIGPYDTRGVAGFFGLAVRGRSEDGVIDHCPVIVRPALEGDEDGGPLGVRVGLALDAARKGPIASLALVEAAGIGALPLSLVRTLAPRLVGRHRARRVPRIRLRDDDRAAILEAVVAATRSLDLEVPLLVVLGHGGTTVNQAHRAGYQCGACGGSSGAPNAVLLAELLSTPWVRDSLRARGMRLHPELLVVGGWHDTTSGKIHLIAPGGVPEARRAELDRVRVDLEEAGRRYQRERARGLGDAPLSRRAGDWAEVRPEWGAAGNALLVIGERALTRGVDLAGRAFLCSWSAARDPEGEELASILAGPLRVAHGISAQYYLQAVAPEIFGAGDKVGLNPIPGIGVVLGQGGDLRLGMPWQSFMAHGSLRHEPLRLAVVVDAPIELVDRVLSRLPEPRALVEGAWVQLVARGGDGCWLLCSRLGSWRRIDGGGDREVA